MRKLLIFPTFIIFALLGVGLKTNNQSRVISYNTNYYQVINPLPVVQDMIDQVSEDRILTDLRRLTGVELICVSGRCTRLTNRYTGSADLQWAQDYVKQTLVNLHYSVEELAWASDGHADENILAHKRGALNPNEEIYFVAHLDSYPEGGGLGADDDASGAVALLELARLLAMHNLSQSVTLYFSSGEEEGSLGSHEFVAHYADRLKNTKYLISVEMLGYDANNDTSMELWSQDDNIGFQKMLGEIIKSYPIDLLPEILPGCT